MDLPPPPKEMIEEAEKEEVIYMREMLEKVLTIKEAKCIKLAIWEKLNRHPIVQGIYDLCEAEITEAKRFQDGDPIWKLHMKTYYRKDNPRFLLDRFSCEKVRKNRKWRNSRHPLSIFKDENCKYLRGKKKGYYNETWWELAGKIDEFWWDAIKDGVKGKTIKMCHGKKRFEGYRAFTIDELYRFGYWNFMLLNHKSNRNKAKWEWGYQMP